MIQIVPLDATGTGRLVIRSLERIVGSKEVREGLQG